MQSVVDQPTMISKFLKGYGVPTYGPVPVLPKNDFVDKFEQSNPFPYNPSHAKSLLTSHGWKVVPNGTDVCEKAGTAGNVAPGSRRVRRPTSALPTPAAPPGRSRSPSRAVRLELHRHQDGARGQHVPHRRLGLRAPCASGTPCTEELGWWGGGWEYSPDFYPSGETLFSTDAGSNASNYSNAKADSPDRGHHRHRRQPAPYQNYLSTQLPVLWGAQRGLRAQRSCEQSAGCCPPEPVCQPLPRVLVLRQEVANPA